MPLLLAAELPAWIADPCPSGSWAQAGWRTRIDRVWRAGIGWSVTTAPRWTHFHRNHRDPGTRSVAWRRFFALAAGAARARGSVGNGRSRPG